MAKTATPAAATIQPVRWFREQPQHWLAALQREDGQNRAQKDEQRFEGSPVFGSVGLSVVAERVPIQ